MRKLIFGLVLAAMPVIAQAGTLTTATVTQGPSVTDFDFSLNIAKYNGPQPLQSVQIFISTHVIDSELTLTNSSLSPQTFKFTATVDTIISSSPLSSFLDSVTNPNTILNTGRVTFASGQSVNYGPIDATFKGNSAVSTVSSELAAVTGSGTFNISGHSESGTSFTGGGGNINVKQTQLASITAYAVYTFANTPVVPEPSTLALMGLGGIGLATVAYRRRVSKA